MSTDRWDALLSDSTWYVPAANLLAYRLESDSPDTPIPAGDQTLWSIGTVRNGRFSGSSVARIVDADGGETQSLTQLDGLITRRGQLRISFTTPLGSTITGIGQVRRVLGEQAIEMQMITGAAGAYTTHWAYMVPGSADTTPPEPDSVDGQQQAYRSGSWRWLNGTTWRFSPRSGERGGPRGRFTINGYHNGYLWGSGSERSGQRPFTVLGSLTPEGNLFFNAISSDSFKLRISQGGLLRGNPTTAQARLRPYDAAAGQLDQPLRLRMIEPDPLIDGGALHAAARARTAAPAIENRPEPASLAIADAGLTPMVALAAATDWTDSRGAGVAAALDGSSAWCG